MAACMVLATTRADVNGLVKRELDVRKASFAPMETAVELTGMEYGGITPIGLPADWPLFVDAAVAAHATGRDRKRGPPVQADPARRRRWPACLARSCWTGLGR